MTESRDLLTYPPPRDQANPFSPPPTLGDIRITGRLERVQIWDGQQAWLITRYEDARLALGDSRLSADPATPGFPEKSAAYANTIGQDRNLRTMDNPEHDAQKRMMVRDFTVKRVEQIRPMIRAKVNGLVDAMIAAGPPADIVHDLAFPVPTMVICEMLGVPYEHRDFFGDRSNTCLSIEVSAETAAQAGAELNEFLEKLIAIREQEPADDLLSRLVTEQLSIGALTRGQVIDLARLVLVTGHETTANMISLSVLSLLQNPEQLADLKANLDDRQVLGNAIEELLRYLSIAHTGRRRAAIQDLEIAGQVIRAGEGVIIANNVADRDESVFTDPDRLDIRRTNARHHLAFGYGIHQCLGQLLSRVELQVVHDVLWRRLPDLRLAEPFELIPFKADGSVYGLRSLPVTW